MYGTMGHLYHSYVELPIRVHPENSGAENSCAEFFGWNCIQGCSDLPVYWRMANFREMISDIE